MHALFQLMRWCGLAIRDALTLKRGEMQLDKAKKLYRIVTARQKTGTHVSVPIPPEIAEELLTRAERQSRVHLLVRRRAKKKASRRIGRSITSLRASRPPRFQSDGHMMSHRLRDTFAVDLLEKGVPLEEVSKLLGHESIKTTERHYAKWVKGRQDRLDTLVSGTWKRQ